MFAYIAGLIDGEGCIYVCKEDKGGKFLRRRIRLQITNTNKELIDACLALTGVGRATKGVQQNSRWKRRYDWVCYGRAAEKVLIECFPYLIAKREQALLALSFINGISRGDTCQEEMHKLNRKGYAV